MACSVCLLISSRTTPHQPSLTHSSIMLCGMEGPTHINHQSGNCTIVYLQANLVVAFSQFKFPLPEVLKPVSSYHKSSQQSGAVPYSRNRKSRGLLGEGTMLDLSVPSRRLVRIRYTYEEIELEGASVQPVPLNHGGSYQKQVSWESAPGTTFLVLAPSLFQRSQEPTYCKRAVGNFKGKNLPPLLEKSKNNKIEINLWLKLEVKMNLL